MPGCSRSSAFSTSATVAPRARARASARELGERRAKPHRRHASILDRITSKTTNGRETHRHRSTARPRTRSRRAPACSEELAPLGTPRPPPCARVLRELVRITGLSPICQTTACERVLAHRRLVVAGYDVGLTGSDRGLPTSAQAVSARARSTRSTILGTRLAEIRAERSPSLVVRRRSARSDLERRDDALFSVAVERRVRSVCTSMNSSPSPYLVTRLQSIQRGTRSTSSCSTFTHSTGPMPPGSRRSPAPRRARREPAAFLLPDHGRVQALLDRRPDGEGGSEVVALDGEVRAVADPDLVDLGEELVRRVACEDVRSAGLDADADEREETLVRPGGRSLELVVAELDADLLVRPRRMRLGEGHRHVEVRDTGVEARVEDRDVEQRDRPRSGRRRHASRRISASTASLLDASIPWALKRLSSSCRASSAGRAGS